jgi:tetratricopeptide (TPR) repeat protein
MKSNNSSTDPDVEFSDCHVYVHSIGFSGSYSRSKNGKYIIAWKDGYFKAEGADIEEPVDTEGIEKYIKFVKRVIKEGGNPDWKDRFLKAVEKRIYEVSEVRWMDEFYKIIENEIPEGNQSKWRNRFIDAMIKDVDKAAENAIREIDKKGGAKLAAGILVKEDSGNDDVETDWTTWQKGQVVLLRGEAVIYTGEAEQPSIGRVANNGIFIIADAMTGEGSKSTLWAYASSGQKITQHPFSANMKTIGLSDEGRYAICQLFHSETADANTIALVDLESGKLLWQKIPETWVADSFEFDTDNGAIYLVYGEGIKFKYSLGGEFLDKERWYQHRVQNGSGFDLIKIAEGLLNEAGKPIPENAIRDALKLYLLATDRLKSHPYFRAQAYRKIGEIYEGLGDTKNAINNYELALKYNPGVGIKKKLLALKEK